MPPLYEKDRAGKLVRGNTVQVSILNQVMKTRRRDSGLMAAENTYGYRRRASCIMSRDALALPWTEQSTGSWGSSAKKASTRSRMRAQACARGTRGGLCPLAGGACPFVRAEGDVNVADWVIAKGGKVIEYPSKRWVEPGSRETKGSPLLKRGGE